MPFIRIDTIAGRYDAQQRSAMSEILFEAVQAIGAKDGDRFQAFNEHAAGALVFDPEYLGIPHTEGFVAIQITLVEGRSVDDKKRLFALIADRLEKRVGVRPGDIFVNLIETGKENWSFGNGEAQYAPHN